MQHAYKLLNSKGFTSRRKKLRKSSTPSEDIMWKIVRRKNLGYYFRRQYSIGAFVVDFCCAKLQLIVEIDGDSHDNLTALEKDKKREDYFKSLGYQIRRYPAEYVLKHQEAVFYDLKEFCDTLKHSKPSPQPSPSKGEGVRITGTPAHT